MVVSFLSACFHKIKPFHSWCTQNMQYYETRGVGGVGLPERPLQNSAAFNVSHQTCILCYIVLEKQIVRDTDETAI